jgi:hypothetical protein
VHAIGADGGARDVTARDCYVEALRLAPNDADAWHSLGLLLVEMQRAVVNGRRVTMRDCMLTAIRVDPSHAATQQWLDNFDARELAQESMWAR